MIKLDLKKIIEISNGNLFCGNLNDYINVCSVNSKMKNMEDTFFGIKGNIDGSLFYEDAILNGAKTCILNKNISIDEKYKNYSVNIILVDDVFDTLLKLAMYVRENFKGKVIGITGSVGKTTTKEMITNILQSKYKILKTYKNENSKIGVPLTILRLKDEDIMVIEMGISNIGEMDVISKIVKPDIAIITNVYLSHIENFKSKEKLILEKLNITSYMNKGFLILNNDCVDSLFAKKNINKNIMIISYGIDNKSNFNAFDIKENICTIFSTYNLENIKIPYLKPFIYNALASIITAKIFNIEDSIIKDNLNKKIDIEHRLKTYNLKNNITLIDDSYNASKESVINAINTLCYYKKRKILVLADIKEIGDKKIEIYNDISNYINKKNIDIVILIGNVSKTIRKKIKSKEKTIKIFNNELNSRKYIKAILKENDTILFKGSNSMKLFNIVNYLIK